jgi:hypothetical protein
MHRLRKEQSMDAAVMSAMSGVFGSVVGASATAATTWMTQRTIAKRELVKEEVAKRESLYGNFISVCAKLLMDAFTHTLDKPETLLPAYELINRIRLTGSRAVLGEAEHLLARITEQYFSNNLSVEQMRELARSEEADPLRAFGEACRVELKAMRGRL